MGCSHDPFAADKGSTANVRVVLWVISIGNLKRYLDQTTTCFTPKPCHASAETVCVALDSGSCHFLTVFSSIRLFFKYKTPALPATSSCAGRPRGLQLLAPSAHPSEEHPLGDFQRLPLTTQKKERSLSCGFLKSISHRGLLPVTNLCCAGQPAKQV